MLSVIPFRAHMGGEQASSLTGLMLMTGSLVRRGSNMSFRLTSVMKICESSTQASTDCVLSSYKMQISLSVRANGLT